MFKLASDFSLTEDQKRAVNKLSLGLSQKEKNQVLLGVTGSGKTFTMANIIQKLKIPTLIISHNKTLAGQLYQEMRQFFPENAISYFVSYYDFYQPEAYIPQTDTYIEKEAQINELIDKLRLQATTNILTRNDIVVVASVSCIYNIGSPLEYGRFILELKKGDLIDRNQVFKRLIELQYERNEFDFNRGTFRVRGDQIDIYPAYEDWGFRIKLENEIIKEITKFDPLTGVIFINHGGGTRKEQVARPKGFPMTRSEASISGNEAVTESGIPTDSIVIYPAKHYMTDPKIFASTEEQIRHDLQKEVEEHKKEGRVLEATRLLKKVNYDLEMIKEVGYVNGIENYSRYFDGRKPGDPPYSLLNYFKQQFGDNWLVFLDESHMTVPQLRGMYNGDAARKKTLIEFGFRLKSAFDNRPLRFDEFYNQAPKFIYVSATPDEWELKMSKNNVVEQLVRPTGIIDPEITIKPAKNEVQDLIVEIEKRVAKSERVLVTTLTKRIAEDLTVYLKDKKINAEYLHSDIKTLDRSETLNKLRRKDVDVLIGINLLREGLDLPEVTLVAILDADKEGFLRSRTSLIQTMGRAARNVKGEVIIYADTITKSIKAAVAEVNRRRKYQFAYNKKHNIIPTTVKKPIREQIIDYDEKDPLKEMIDKPILDELERIKPDDLTPLDKNKLIKNLKKEMRKKADELNFELAIAIREKIGQLEA